MTITWGLFYLLSIFSIISGILTVVMGKNPINSVVYLVSCFVNCAALFILMGIGILGFIYIIVYVGAIAILFIFVLLMMDLRTIPEKYQLASSDAEMNKTPNRRFSSWFSNKLTGPVFLTILVLIITTLYQKITLITHQMPIPPIRDSIGAFSPQLSFDISKYMLHDLTTWAITYNNAWELNIHQHAESVLHSVGYLLYTDFLSLLLTASLILLMVMISVIALVSSKE